MGKLLIGLLLATLGWASLRADAPPGFSRAQAYCSMFAFDQCLGHPDCERFQWRRCVAALGWRRDPEGWIRVRTDADLGREIERALTDPGASASR